MNTRHTSRRGGRWPAGAALFLTFLTLARGAPVLDALPPATPGGPVRLRGSGDALLRLEASAALTGGWEEIGRFHDALYPWPDGSSSGAGRRYYRLLTSPRTAADDWKNQILATDEPFRTAGDGESVTWVKFSLRPAEPWRVYFQDSQRYPFHYDFATLRLPPFAGMTRPAFDAATLHRDGQQLVLGAVLFPPRANLQEYAVQFSGLDPWPPAQVADWMKSVSAAVHAPAGMQALYMPVYEQSESASRDAAALAALGVTVADIGRWLTVNGVYAPGWALGRLVYVPAADISAAFADGRLLTTDILLTDGLPAETPLVAGILTLTPQTPNSHTAILAQSFGIPFLHIADADEQARLRALAGRRVIVRAEMVNGLGRTKVIDAGDLPAAVEAEMLALKQPEPIGYTPRAALGAVSRSTDQLQPADVRYFGGKAVNYGLLRRTIPANTPPAVALSFDLWDTFLDQTLPLRGRTLRAEIAARLVPHTAWPPPQMTALQSTLSGIRTLIRQEAVMPAAAQQAILTAVAAFDPRRKIRFRSSTNLEDGLTFTGAGLYDSYSGCVMDDTDGDTTGPSHCDPDEPEERGVFRAIQRVYASYYNDNAVLERLRHGVTESECGMAVLVHPSYPDAEELANGVASLDYRYYSFGTNISGPMVTQAGAESVTNPDGSASPEVVDVYRSGSRTYLTARQSSSRVPLGARVLTWEDDYTQFAGLFAQVGTAWRQLTPERTGFSLDFEYKKIAGQGLIVKQVREIPVLSAAEPVTPWLIDEPDVRVVSQEEAGTVFGNHRLKSRWHLRSASGRLTPGHLAAGLYREGTLDYLQAGTLATLTGPLSSWPAAGLSPGGMPHWSTGTATWSLETTLTTSVSGTTPPVVTTPDFRTVLTVSHRTPQPEIDYRNQPVTTTEDYAVLAPPLPMTPGSIRVERVLETGRGLTVRTVFYWPDPPQGIVAGYTAPLVKFEQTTITGLTTQPIVLTDYWSQTYRPGHHNFTEEFLFEPALSAGLPAATRAELQNAGIQALYITGGMQGTPAWIVSPSGALRAR